MSEFHKSCPRRLSEASFAACSDGLLLPSFALDGVHVACARAAGEGSVAIGCADGTLRLFDAGEGDTTWGVRRVLRCAGAGIAFAMEVVPRIDNQLVLQSSIHVSLSALRTADVRRHRRWPPPPPRLPHLPLLPCGCRSVRVATR